MALDASALIYAFTAILILPVLVIWLNGRKRLLGWAFLGALVVLAAITNLILIGRIVP